jgi:hypothetical protein
MLIDARLFAIAAVVFVGCGDGEERCLSPGQSRCRDNVVEVCRSPDSGEDDPVWEREDCGSGVCMAGLGDEAFCARSAEPDPRCEPVEVGSSCDGDELVDCKHGLATTRSADCSSAGRYCVVTPEFAFCNASSEPDPLCPAEEYPAHVCDGNVVVGCAYGYRTGESACGSSSVCRQSDVDHTADCVVEP